MSRQADTNEKQKGGFWARLFKRWKKTNHEIVQEAALNDTQEIDISQPEEIYGETIKEEHKQWEIVERKDDVKALTISERRQARINAEQRVAFFAAEEMKMRKAFDEAKRYAAEAEEARRAAELEAAVKIAEENAATLAESAKEAAGFANQAAEAFSAAETEYNAAEARAELARVEENSLKKRLAARQEDVNARQQSQLQKATAQVREAQTTAEDKRKTAEAATAEAQQCGNDLETAKKKRDEALQDEEFSINRLTTEMEGQIASAKERLKQAEEAFTCAIGEEEKTKTAAEQSERQLQKLTEDLAKAKEDAAAAVADEKRLQQTLAQEMTELQQNCQESIRNAKAETDRIVELGVEKRRLLQSCEILLSQAEAALIRAEEAAASAALAEKDVAEQLERETSMIAARVEAALNAANSKRQNYLDIQKIVEENMAAAIKANALEKGAEEKVARLKLEEKDARVAAETSQRLADDALQAKGNADDDSVQLLVHAENILVETVRNATKLAEEKEKLRLQAEAQAAEAVIEARKCRELASQSQSKAAEAEKIWRAAEEELVHISSLAETEKEQCEEKYRQMSENCRQTSVETQTEVNKARTDVDSATLKLEMAKKAIADTERMRIAAEEEEAKVISRSEAAQDNAVRKTEELLRQAQELREKTAAEQLRLNEALLAQEEKYAQNKQAAEEAGATKLEAEAMFQKAQAELKQICNQAKKQIDKITEDKELLRKAAQAAAYELEERYEQLAEQARQKEAEAESAAYALATAKADLSQTEKDIADEQAKLNEEFDRELADAAGRRIAAEEQAAILKNKMEVCRRTFDDAVRIADEQEAKRIAAEAEVAGKTIEVKAGLLKIKADSARETARQKAEDLEAAEKAWADANGEVDRINAEEVSIRLSMAETTARLAGEGEAEEKTNRSKAASLAKKRNKLQQSAAQLADALAESEQKQAAAEEGIKEAEATIGRLQEEQAAWEADWQKRQTIAEEELRQKQEQSRRLYEESMEASQRQKAAKQEREEANAHVTAIDKQIADLEKQLEDKREQIKNEFVKELTAQQKTNKQLSEKEAQLNHALRQAEEKCLGFEQEQQLTSARIEEEQQRLNELKENAKNDLARLDANAEAMAKTANGKRDLYFSAQKAIEDTAAEAKEKESQYQALEEDIKKLRLEAASTANAAEKAAQLAESATAAREAAEEGAAVLLAQAEKALKAAADEAAQLAVDKQDSLASREKELLRLQSEWEAARAAAAEAPRLAAEMVSVWLAAEEEINRIKDETEQNKRATDVKYNKQIADQEKEIAVLHKHQEESVREATLGKEKLQQLETELNQTLEEKSASAQMIESLKADRQRRLQEAEAELMALITPLYASRKEAEQSLDQATTGEQQCFAIALAAMQAAEAAATAATMAQDHFKQLTLEGQEQKAKQTAQAEENMQIAQETKQQAEQTLQEALSDEERYRLRIAELTENMAKVAKEYDELTERMNIISSQISDSIKETEEKAAEALREKAKLRIAAEEKAAKLALIKENKRLDFDIAERVAKEAEIAFKAALDKAARFAAEAEKARQISEGRLPQK